MNITILAGYLGNEPELTQNANGTTKLSLRLATASMRPNGDEFVEHTEWHNVTIWGKRGEALSRVLCKGRFVVFMGANTTSTWDDRESGKKRSKTEVVIGPMHTVTFGPDPRRREGNDEPHPAEHDGRPATQPSPPPAAPMRNQGRGRG